MAVAVRSRDDAAQDRAAVIAHFHANPGAVLDGAVAPAGGPAHTVTTRVALRVHPRVALLFLPADLPERRSSWWTVSCARSPFHSWPLSLPSNILCLPRPQTMEPPPLLAIWGSTCTTCPRPQQRPISQRGGPLGGPSPAPDPRSPVLCLVNTHHVLRARAPRVVVLLVDCLLGLLPAPLAAAIFLIDLFVLAAATNDGNGGSALR